jgi:L-2,4-diaminobutyrate decarboxylase
MSYLRLQLDCRHLGVLSKMRRDRIDRLIDGLYPEDWRRTEFTELCGAAVDTLSGTMPSGALPRVPGWKDESGHSYADLVSKYSELREQTTDDARSVVESMTRDLLAGAPLWRCRELHYNVGASVNVAASAMYAVGLDANLFLINDGLAGNSIVAEIAVGNILAQLAGVDPEKSAGVFSFGGTATMLYATKIGLLKADPRSRFSGVPRGVKVLITEDAHFCHATNLDWLGIGLDNAVMLSPTEDRRTNIEELRTACTEVVRRGEKIACLLINGGTTYDHSVDDIDAVVEIRDALVKDFGLDYRPHIHVDSVIGWVWLNFRGYDFAANPLDIDQDVLDLISRQYDRIKKINKVDSWGVDFHKGAGGCPIDCSFFMCNDREDFARLSKAADPKTTIHQLAGDFSQFSPVDYTLESSRSGGKALAALTMFQTLGLDGYRIVLARLLRTALSFRMTLMQSPDAEVANAHAFGYATMARLYAPELSRDERRPLQYSSTDKLVGEYITLNNKYLQAFFTWDNESRMDVNGGGVVYSFSNKYIRSPAGPAISGLKFYPVSPRTTENDAIGAAQFLLRRKRQFDTEVWKPALGSTG